MNAVEKIEQIRALITELDSELQSIADSDVEIPIACGILADINFLKRDLTFVYDGYAHLVGKIMGSTESIKLDNGAEIEKKSSYDRKSWDHKALASAVSDKLVKMSIDMDTGEVLKSPREIAMDMVTYCAPSYWRVNELNKIGINPDNYCEVGELKTSIIVRKPKDSE